MMEIQKIAHMFFNSEADKTLFEPVWARFILLLITRSASAPRIFSSNLFLGKAYVHVYAKIFYPSLAHFGSHLLRNPDATPRFLLEAKATIIFGVPSAM